MFDEDGCLTSKDPMKRPSATVEVITLFQTNGHSEYGSEAVTQLEHALQAALFAEKAAASPALIAAALLHDVGHLLHSLPDDAPERGIDDHHETLAARWLAKRYGPEVVEPVRMHVMAKRYLCATEGYLEQLSPPSVVSLHLQGGPMTDKEAAEFRSHPHADAAIALRRWDDEAKIVGQATPDLEHFAQYLDQVATRSHEFTE